MKTARETALQFVHWVIGAQSSNDSSNWAAEPIEKITQALESRDETIRELRLELGSRHVRIKALREALKGYATADDEADAPINQAAIEALAADDKAASE